MKLNQKMLKELILEELEDYMAENNPERIEEVWPFGGKEKKWAAIAGSEEEEEDIPRPVEYIMNVIRERVLKFGAVPTTLARIQKNPAQQAELVRQLTIELGAVQTAQAASRGAALVRRKLRQTARAAAPTGVTTKRVAEEGKKTRGK